MPHQRVRATSLSICQRVRARRMRAAPGFTLVELMVVLVIVGLMGAAVVLTAPGGRGALAADAETFAMRLVRAQEEAILGTRAVEVVVDSQGYAFNRQRFGQWQPLREGPFGPIEWSGAVTPLLDRDRARVTFRFDPAGEARVQALTLTDGEHRLQVSVDDSARVLIDGAPRATGIP